MSPNDFAILAQMVLCVIGGMILLPIVWLCIAAPFQWIVQQGWQQGAPRSPFTVIILILVILGAGALIGFP